MSCLDAGGIGELWRGDGGHTHEDMVLNFHTDDDAVTPILDDFVKKVMLK